MDSPYLTAEEAAAYCRVKVQTLYNRRAAGDGPDALPGAGRLLFTKDALDRWLASKPKRKRTANR